MLLDKARRGHPEAGALWDKQLGTILRKQGWSKADYCPGTWWQEKTMPMLVTYVDDLMLACSSEELLIELACCEPGDGFTKEYSPLALAITERHAIAGSAPFAGATRLSLPLVCMVAGMETSQILSIRLIASGKQLFINASVVIAHATFH